MLDNETIYKLRHMKLTGMVEALQSQEEDGSFQELSFFERLGLIVDWEYSRRDHNQINRLISQAKFQDSMACVENISYTPIRRIDKNLVLQLASCNYVMQGRNIIIMGPTGAGKSYIAQALGQAACRKKLTTRYIHMSEMLNELRIAKAQSPDHFFRMVKRLTKYKLLIIDEFLLFPIQAEDVELLLMIIDRRLNKTATIIVTQYEPAEWLDQMAVPLAAEALTDRLAARSYKITITSKESMRRFHDQEESLETSE